MIRNYFTIALRNLRKNKLHSFINLAGLSIGLACCLLIFIYVQRELSYDRYHEKSKQIYRLTAILHLPKEDRPRAVTSPPMGPAIRSNFPEVQNMVRINYSSRYISYQNNKQFDLKIIYADSTFFDIFTFPLIESIDRRPLEKPFSVVLTQSTAKKYFGDEDPIGKTVQLSDTIPLKVTGLIADVPQNSHFSFDCLMSRSTIDELNQRRPDNNWFNNNYYTYLLLKNGTNARALEKKVSDYILSQMQEAKKASGLWYDLKLQPLRDIHLKSNLNAEIGPNSDISYIYIFSAAAIFILLIACSNFINLSTAKSLERTKEIGLRKTVGARRPQLMLQFLGESLFFCLVAGIVSLILVITSLPYFNQLTGLSVDLSDLKDPMLIGIYVGVIIFVSVVAGLYPAILLSSFQPVLALKESVKGTVHHLVLKKGLVVFQFVVAIGLIIGTIVVYRQLRYIQERNLGLDKEQVVQVEIPPADQAKGKILQTSLATNPRITNVSLNDFSFSNGFSSVAVLPEGANENELNSLPVISVDEHFIPTFKITLLTGRNFQAHIPRTSTTVLY
jgi:putative ABC transport system permease protein